MKEELSQIQKMILSALENAGDIAIENNKLLWRFLNDKKENVKRLEKNNRKENSME
jgi:hypothetical protein